MICAARLARPCALVDQLEGELHLTGRAGGAVDEAEAGAPHDIGRQSKVDQVEDIEDLSAELEGKRFPASPAAEGRVFGQRDVKIMEPRAAKGIAPELSGPSLVWTCSPGHVDGDEEEGRVLSRATEAVFPHLAAGGDNRLSDLVRPIGAR